MVRAGDGPLEERPHAFDGVGVNVGADVLLGAVIHGLMARVVVRDAAIAGMVVRTDRGGLGLRGGLDEGMERSCRPSR